MSLALHQRNLGFSLAVLLIIGGCASTPDRRTSDTRRPDTPSSPSSTAPVVAPVVVPKSVTVQQLINEASALAPLATSPLARRFLAATESLPTIGTRTVHQMPQTRNYYSPAATADLPPETRARLVKIDLEEYRYYYTKYGSPLAYMRALELVAARGMSDLSGRRVLDFGYGSIGHLRLMASLGASVTGVDPDSYLSAIYADPRDQGVVPAARDRSGNAISTRDGSITLAHGYYPKESAIVTRVGRGYDLILSKNTLKRGYIKPERRAPKEQLIELGVKDEIFLSTLADALNPGGILLIYNLAPAQAPANKPFLPMADARSPFSREQYTKAGLSVIAFDVEDHDFVRRMGRALGWDKSDKGETTQDLNTNLFALYTMVEKARK